MESEFGTAGSPTVLVNENVRKPEKQLEEGLDLLYVSGDKKQRMLR